MNLLLLAALGVAAAGSQGGYMVLPPEGPAGTGGGWIGALVDDALPRELAFLGLPVVLRGDRIRAFEGLSIPPVSLSRATAIRAAEALGVSRLLVGRVETEGEGAPSGRVKLFVSVLDVERGALGEPLVASGALAALPQLVKRLAWDVALTTSTPPTVTSGEYFGRGPKPPLAALRAYARALLARDSPTRLRQLERALRLWPFFDEARLALGELYLDEGQRPSALRVLEGVPRGSALRRAARFLAGRAELDEGRYGEAVALYDELVTESATPGALNNLALAVLRRESSPEPGRAARRASDVLRRATEIDPGLAEPAFNLGWALLVEGEPEGAAFWIRGTLRDDPKDVHARLALVWSLRRAGRAEEAEEEWRDLLALAPSYEGLGTPDLARRFERVMSAESPPALKPDRWGDAQVAASHVGRALRLGEEGDLDGAFAELTQAAYLDPYSARAHLELGRLHGTRGRGDLAVGELRMSLWCRNDPAVRVELARRLQEMGRGDEARAEARTALQDDPANLEARSIAAGR